MAKKRQSEIYLIMLCGLPAVGKSTIARKLLKVLPDHILIEQNQIRRDIGYKRMPKNGARNHDSVLRTIDRTMARHLLSGVGVICDSVNRYTFRRLQIYGVASACGVRGVALEVVCSDQVAKARMTQRPKGDGLISDPKSFKVFYNLKKEWEPLSTDFVHFGSDHINYIRYDSSSNKLARLIQHRGSRGFISKIEKALTKT